MMNTKRLFFALETLCPWPELPDGRVLDPQDRHITLSFLGNVDFDVLKDKIDTIPPFQVPVSFAGFFDQMLFFPEKVPTVAAWRAHLFDESLSQYQKQLENWLVDKGYTPKKHPTWIPHLTLARKPFDQKVWEQQFHFLPFQLGNFVLYESLGHSKYRSLWSFDLIKPFQEIKHAADIAFEIHGTSFLQLYQNAFTALCFRFPLMTGKLSARTDFKTLDEVIEELNLDFARLDAEIGIPFKAVSYHGDFEDEKIKKWKMVVDV